MTVATAFEALRRMAGWPIMTCVKPISDWGASIPNGYAYDDRYNEFINDAGAIWEPTLSTLPGDSIPILAQAVTELFELAPVGLFETGDKRVTILPASKNTVEAAYAILLDDRVYEVREIAAWPSGASSPLYYEVQLRQRS